MLPRKGGRSYRFRGKIRVCNNKVSETGKSYIEHVAGMLPGCLFIILHVLGIQAQLEMPRRLYLVELGASFPRESPNTSQCTRLNLQFHIQYLRLRNSSYAELSQVQCAESQQLDGPPEGASDTSEAGNKYKLATWFAGSE